MSMFCRSVGCDILVASGAGSPQYCAKHSSPSDPLTVDFHCHWMGCTEYRMNDSNFCAIHHAEHNATSDPLDYLRSEALKGATIVGPSVKDLIRLSGRTYEVDRKMGDELWITRFDLDETRIILNSNPNFRVATGEEEYQYLKEKELYQASFRPGMESEEDEFFDPGSFEGQLGQVLAEMEELLLKKNKDYGSSYDDTVEELGEWVILVRIKDKFNRLKQLLKSGEDPEVEETIEETLSDLVGYGIIELVRRRRL